MIEFCVTLERNYALWINAIKKGKLDGTITNDLNESQIAQFVFMPMMGMEDEMKR
ncbi:MAG: hypothetical protein ACFFEF_18720 [Candidatus Thorarchaeota archaeon]